MLREESEKKEGKSPLVPLSALLKEVVGRAGFEPAKAEPADLQSSQLGMFRRSPTFLKPINYNEKLRGTLKIVQGIVQVRKVVKAMRIKEKTSLPPLKVVGSFFLS